MSDHNEEVEDVAVDQPETVDSAESPDTVDSSESVEGESETVSETIPATEESDTKDKKKSKLLRSPLKRGADWNASLEGVTISNDEELAAANKKANRLLYAGGALLLSAVLVVGGVTVFGGGSGDEHNPEVVATAPVESPAAVETPVVEIPKGVHATESLLRGDVIEYVNSEGTELKDSYNSSNYTFSQKVSEHMNDKYGFPAEKMWYLLGVKGAPGGANEYWFTEGDSDNPRVFKVEQVETGVFQDSFAEILFDTQELETKFLKDYPDVLGFLINKTGTVKGTTQDDPMTDLGSFYRQGFYLTILVNDGLYPSSEVKYKKLVEEITTYLMDGKPLRENTIVSVYESNEGEWDMLKSDPEFSADIVLDRKGAKRVGYPVLVNGTVLDAGENFPVEGE